MEKKRNSQSDAIRGRTLLLATLAVMFGLNRWTGVEQWGQVPEDGQSSEIAAMPKPPLPSTPTRLALSIDVLANRKGNAQTSRAPDADPIPAQVGNRKCPHETVSETLAVEQATGCEGCDHKTATTWTVQEPWARRNASTVGSGTPMAAGKRSSTGAGSTGTV
jgi:hypothetical protein